MKPDFRPDLMTKDIVYCLLEQCPQANNCLRYLAYQHSSAFSIHSFVDSRRAVSEVCPHYLSNRVQRQARGFKRAIGFLPYHSVASFRGRAAYELNCGRSHYYRYSSGEAPLSEAQQTIVRAVFREFGVEQENLFGAYEEGYELPYYAFLPPALSFSLTLPCLAPFP